jgi:archaellum biogenesis ATPase FlaH
VSEIEDEMIEFQKRQLDMALGRAIIINMEDIEVESVNWLWYPYIPFGKITVIQGDPGNGKTTFILAVASIVTNGLSFPATENNIDPSNIIYQTAEDGLADTIKPRLLQYGADCKRVFVIDESYKNLTLDDLRIEEAITKLNAKMLVIDPLQAFLGACTERMKFDQYLRNCLM